MRLHSGDFKIELNIPAGKLTIESPDGALSAYVEFDAQRCPDAVAVGMLLANIGAVIAGVPVEVVNAVTVAAAEVRGELDPLEALAAGPQKKPVLQ